MSLLRMLHTALNLVNDALGTLGANIVDDNVSTKFAHHDGIRATKAGTSTSDDNSLAVEADGRLGLLVSGELLRFLEVALRSISKASAIQ